LLNPRVKSSKVDIYPNNEITHFDIGDGYMLRDFLLGFVRIHILHHASREPVYGLWLIEELGRHGYRLSPGTLYPILHHLEKEKILKSHAKNINGRMRKYYSATKKGKKIFSEIKKSVRVFKYLCE
jgi:PadR family transcriptional regulator PadR